MESIFIMALMIQLRLIPMI